MLLLQSGKRMGEGGERWSGERWAHFKKTKQG